MNTATLTRRDVYADYVKGLLIILVVMGHAIQHLKYHNPVFWDDYIYKSIYMFHMPLFIGISGYYSCFSLKRKPALSFIKERMILLLVPLITWGIMNGLFDIIAKGNTIPDKYMYIYMTIRWSYWFIWALLIYSVILGVLKLVRLDNKYVIMVTGVLSMLVPLFFTQNVILAFTKDMFVFFILGYLLTCVNINKLYLICKKYFIIIIVLVIACYCVWTKEDLIYFTPSDIFHLKTGILRLISGIILSTAFLAITFFIYGLTKSSKFIHSLAQLGTKTMGIYMIQGFLFSCLASNFLFNLNILPSLPSIFYIIPTLFIIIVIYFVIKLIEMNWLTAFIFLGKKKKAKAASKQTVDIVPKDPENEYGEIIYKKYGL